MDSNFINQLVDIIASPLGLVGIVIALVIVYQAGRSRRLAWFLFTMCCFAASLAKFKDEFVKEAPALVFPLQQIRDMGRPLTILLLVLLLFLGLKKQRGWRRKLIAPPIKYLALVQLVIFFKTLAFGSIGFAFLAIFTFGAVILMLRLGPSRWLQDDQNFHMSVWSLAMVGVIFVIANGYQAVINIYPITFVHGRLLGTTGNPLHAAVLLSATVPCFMFLIESQKQWGWLKACWITGLVFIMLGLLLTGSRTGAIMGVVSILLFYRQKGGDMLRLGLFAAIVLAIILPLLSQDASISGDSIAVTGRFASTENTRAEVWSEMWDGFMNNIFFGIPLHSDRLSYGENSWLAAGANLGLLGLTPLIMFGLGCINMMLRLYKISNRESIYSLQCNAVIAGLMSLLVGSIFEAFLLGNLTFSLMILLMYLSLGQYLIEVNIIQEKYLLWQKQSKQAVF